MVTKLFEKIYYLDNESEPAFSLYLECIESDNPIDNLYWLKSDVILAPMLEHFEELISPLLVFRTKDSDPDKIYLEELLDFISLQILNDPAYRPFFYIQGKGLFLDHQNVVRPEVIRKFDNARTEISHGYCQLVNLSRPLHLYYFSQLIRIPKRYLNGNRFSVHRITRQTFETCLNEHFKAEEYIDIYFSAVRFKLIRGKDKQPLYFVALNERNEPILAIKAEEQD